MKKIFLSILILASAFSYGQVGNQYLRTIFNVKAYGAHGDNGTTNNTVPFKNCMAALIANGGGKFFIPYDGGGYLVDSFTVPGVQGVNNSSYIPIEVEGETGPNYIFGSATGTSTLPTRGTLVYTTNTTSGNSVFRVDGYGAGFSAVMVTIKNVELRSYDNPSIGGLDAQWAAFFRAENVFINAGIYNSQNTAPTHGTVGLNMPNVNNGAMSIIRNVTVTGYWTGIRDNEHTDGDNVNIASCIRGINFVSAFHSSRYGRADFFRNTYNIYVSGVNRFSITQMNIEHDDSTTVNPSYYQATLADIKDTANLGVADITWAVVKGNVGIDHTFTVIGGTGIVYREIGSSGGGGGVAGSNTQVQYNNSSSFAGASNLVIDNVNNRVGVGINAATPLVDLHVHSNRNGPTALVVQNSTSGAAASASLQALNNSGLAIQMGMLSATTTPYGGQVANGSFVYTASPVMNFMVDVTGGAFTWDAGAGAPAPELMRLNSSGLGVGLNVGTIVADLDVHTNKNGTTRARVNNANSCTTCQSAMDVVSSDNIAFEMLTTSGTTTAYGDLKASTGAFYTTLSGGIAFMSDANAPITFSTGSGSPAPERMRIAGTGNTLFGSTTDVLGLIQSTSSGSGIKTLFAGQNATAGTGNGADIIVANDLGIASNKGVHLYSFSSTFTGSSNAAELWNYNNGDFYLATNNAQFILAKASGNILLGTNSTDNSTALVQIQKTTAQLALHYDATHDAIYTVNSSGNLNVTPSGGTMTVTGNLALGAAGNALNITEGTNGRVGQTTLVSGTKAITISGLTTSSRAFVTLVSQGGTVTTTVSYIAVCTSNTITISAVTSAGGNAVDTTDTSVVNYFIIN